MYPPFPTLLTRKAIKDHYLGGIPIKKGFSVSVGLLASHFKEESYDKPLEFNPDRWNDSGNKSQPFSFIPFSAGVRTCAGQYLSTI